MKKLSRRNFLSSLLVSTAIASFMPKFAFANLYSNNNLESNWLSFSTQKGIGPQLDEHTLMQRYCALHKETPLPVNRIGQSDYRITVSLLEKVLSDQGIRWEKSNRVLWTYQHYGVCDPSIHSNRLLSYSRLVQEYLYSHVSGLEKIIPVWSLLVKEHNRLFVETKGYKGLVGKYTYLIFRVSGLDKDGLQILPGLVNVMPIERAINYIVDDENHNPIGSTIFVLHGPTSLVSPFTELIHLTTHQPTLRLKRELSAFIKEEHAQLVSREYGESITEAAGILLSLSFLQKYGHAGEENIVRAVSQNISNQFPLVGIVMVYMIKNGVQQVLNAYSENPGRVIKEI